MIAVSAAQAASQTLMLVVFTCRPHTTTEGWRHAGAAPQAAWDTETRRARWSQGSQHCELQQSRQWAATPGNSLLKGQGTEHDCRRRAAMLVLVEISLECCGGPQGQV